MLWSDKHDKMPEEQQSSSSLITTLYQKHASAILTYLQIHSTHSQDAEDLLVEVFLAALKTSYLYSLTDEEQRAWLWRVAHNKLADHFRQKGRYHMIPLEEVHEDVYSDERLEPDHVALQSETYTQLVHALGQLSRLEQQILQLRFVHGLRCTEIATRLGKKEGAVRTMLSRSLNRLRSLYPQT